MQHWEDRPPLTDRQERELEQIARDPRGLPVDGARVDNRTAEALLRRGLVARVTDLATGDQRWVATIRGLDVAEQVA
jgi:hypothetical protein